MCIYGTQKGKETEKAVLSRTADGEPENSLAETLEQEGTEEAETKDDLLKPNKVNKLLHTLNNYSDFTEL